MAQNEKSSDPLVQVWENIKPLYSVLTDVFAPVRTRRQH